MIEPAKTGGSCRGRSGLVPGRLVDLRQAQRGRSPPPLCLAGRKTTTSVAELAQELSLPLSSVLSLLGPEGLLRGCALVEVTDGAELGWAVPQDLLRVGRGLHLLCGSLGQPAAASDELMPLSATLPGLAVLSAPAPGRPGCRSCCRTPPASDPTPPSPIWCANSWSPRSPCSCAWGRQCRAAFDAGPAGSSAAAAPGGDAGCDGSCRLAAAAFGAGAASSAAR